MSRRRCAILVVLLLAAADCKYRRGVTAFDAGAKDEIAFGPIDWDESAGVFIGIETFHAADRPLDVPFAADDATDLAYLFANELRLLPPARTVLMVSGRPSKERSRRHLEELRRSAHVVLDDVDAKRVGEAIARQVPEVGPNGVLVLSIATHGYTNGGQHVLLTADSGALTPKGIVLGDILRQQRRGRLLLFVDACRERLARLPVPGTPTAMTESFFDELRNARAYAVLVASVPGGYAYSDEVSQNGFFTSALLDALRREPTAQTEGCIVTLSGLESRVGEDVLKRSAGRQQPEARFGGGLADLCIVDGEAPDGEIVAPPPGAIVRTSGDVDIRVRKPRLFATVWLCAARNGVCYNQTPGPVPTTAETRVHVQYGTPDRFEIYVALSTDYRFLAGTTEFPDGPPFERRTHGLVRWLGPVSVTLPSPEKEASP